LKFLVCKKLSGKFFNPNEGEKFGQHLEEYFNSVILNAGGVNNFLELRSVKMDGFFNRDNKLA